LLERQNQSFVFDVESQPSLINVDAEKSLLGEKIEKKTVAQYVFQYNNAPLFLDRLEAFQVLSQKLPQEKQAREVLIKSLTDKSWQIRLAAVNAIDQLKDEEKAEVYEIVKNMAVSDSRSYVRAAAITVLSKTFTNRDNQETFQKAFSDKAPSVQKALAAAVK
jgi:aminopeptidase N